MLQNNFSVFPVHSLLRTAPPQWVAEDPGRDMSPSYAEEVQISSLVPRPNMVISSGFSEKSSWVKPGNFIVTLATLLRASSASGPSCGVEPIRCKTSRSAPRTRRSQNKSEPRHRTRHENRKRNTVEVKTVLVGLLSLPNSREARECV